MKAIFAGTFDPFTAGHRDIVERAQSVFGSVIVAVADDCDKKAVPLDIRVDIAKASVTGIKNAEVLPFSGLLTDFAAAHSPCILVRGVRSARDLDYERELCAAYKISGGPDAVIFLSAPEHLGISSTTVRALARLGGDITKFVVPAAHQRIVQVYGKNAYKE